MDSGPIFPAAMVVALLAMRKWKLAFWSLVGVVLIFWLTSSTFDSSARIGLILMFGIVVNNAILLISRFRTESSLILKIKQGGDP